MKFVFWIMKSLDVCSFSFKGALHYPSTECFCIFPWNVDQDLHNSLNNI